MKFKADMQRDGISPKAKPRAQPHRAIGDGETLYAIVARSLKDDITNGVLPVGAQLPTEAALCTRFSVSRHTVREALRQLRDDRMILSRQGAGTIVAGPATDAFSLQANSINDLVSYSADMKLDVESTKFELVEGRLATRLGIEGGDEWLVVRGLVRTTKKQMPVCWSEHYINRDFAAVARVLPRCNGPIFLLIEDMFALTIDEIDQEITAGVVPHALASSLKVNPGAASIEVRRTFWTSGGKLAQVTRHTHPAPRFSEKIKIRRVKS